MWRTDMRENLCDSLLWGFSCLFFLLPSCHCMSGYHRPVCWSARCRCMFFAWLDDKSEGFLCSAGGGSLAGSPTRCVSFCTSVHDEAFMHTLVRRNSRGLVERVLWTRCRASRRRTWLSTACASTRRLNHGGHRQLLSRSSRFENVEMLKPRGTSCMAVLPRFDSARLDETRHFCLRWAELTLTASHARPPFLTACIRSLTLSPGPTNAR